MEKTKYCSRLNERNETITFKVLDGNTLSEVAREYSLTTGRIRQIVYRICRRQVYRKYRSFAILKKFDMINMLTLKTLRSLWKDGKF